MCLLFRFDVDLNSSVRSFFSILSTDVKTANKKVQGEKYRKNDKHAISNGKGRCSITENLEPREPFAYCPRIYRLSFSSSFAPPLFLSRSSRSLDTYINYTIVLHSCTCSVEIHARRLRRQAWSGIEIWFLNHLFSSFFFRLLLLHETFTSIHPAFVHSHAFSLSHAPSHHPRRIFFFLFTSIYA